MEELSFSFDRRKDANIIKAFEANLNTQGMQASLREYLLKASKKIEDIRIRSLDNGTLWVNAFCRKPRSKSKYKTDKAYPYGILSLKLSFVAKNNKLYIFIEDVFYLGFVVSGIFSKLRTAIGRFFQKQKMAESNAMLVRGRSPVSRPVFRSERSQYKKRKL